MGRSRRMDEPPSTENSGCGCAVTQCGVYAERPRTTVYGRGCRNSIMKRRPVEIACWGILIVLLNTIASIEANSTTPMPVTVTAPENCKIVFTAEKMTDVFTDACAPITFECGGLSELQRTDPTGDCSRFFTCAARIVWSCPCGPGTKFDATTGACRDAFHANCTCPDGRAPATDGPPTLPPPSSNVGLIAGVVVGVLVIFSLLVIIIIIVIKKRKQKAKPMMPSLGPQLSVRSGGYNEIDYNEQNKVTYDNGPLGETAIYDNHGFNDREAIRPRLERETVTSAKGTAPALPGGHPSLRNPANLISEEKNEETGEVGDGASEEPEYMDAIQ